MKEYAKKILNELKKEYIRKYKDDLISIVLFGSYANNLFTPCSDVDLLIILSKFKEPRCKYYIDFFTILEKLPTYKEMKEKKINLYFSPIIKRSTELKVYLPYLWNTNFKIFYDRKKFFKKFIQKLNEFKKKKIRFKEGTMPYYEMIKNG